MTATVRDLLNSFDALSDREKREAAAEILRRVLGAAPAELPELALVEAADEIFRALDAEEANDAP